MSENELEFEARYAIEDMYESPVPYLTNARFVYDNRLIDYMLACGYLYVHDNRFVINMNKKKVSDWCRHHQKELDRARAGKFITGKRNW